MPLRKKAPQKLVSFSDNSADLDRIRKDMANGWALISLIQNAGHYVGVMEQMDIENYSPDNEGKFYIPPRKKIKISY